MITAKVGRRGQVTIPKDVRKRLGIAEGQRVAFVQRGGETVLLPLNEKLSDHKGSIPVEGPQDFDAIQKQVKAQRARKRVHAGLSERVAAEDGV